MKRSKGHIVGVGSRFNAIQTGLDVVGMTEIPIISQSADLASGAMSLATGDYVGAALSVGGLIPGVGQAAGAAKMARRVKIVGEMASNTKQVVKQTTKLGDLTGGIPKNNPAIQQHKFGDLIGKPKIEEAKKALAKNSEVDAKPPKKAKAAEKEDVAVEGSTVQNKHRDISDGPTNQGGGSIDEAILKNMSNSGVPKTTQKTNYYEFIKQVENGKPFNNPISSMGKKQFGI